MRLLTTTICFTVDDPPASSAFLRRHFGYGESMAFDGGAALAHPDGGPSVFFLRTGLWSLDERRRHLRAQGVILALTVEDADREHARLSAEGATPLGPVHQDDWGERSFQVADPNGVMLQVVQWVGERPY